MRHHAVARSLIVSAVFVLGIVTVRLQGAGIKETVRLTISGSGVAEPIRVTEPSVLALSNVYDGSFIGEPAAAAPDADWNRFVISFDIQTGNGVKRDGYAVTFAKNRWTDEALVYLPGPGDAAYRRNISTILREGADGTWRRTSRAWADAISARLR
ncbi:MAG TPA: hypothetical protein VH583_06815 [Vicinamibacterales bacterium]|jgi:hypothetical protein